MTRAVAAPMPVTASSLNEPVTASARLTVLAAIFVVTLAVNLQVPLYQTYAQLAGYRQGLLSVTFAAYVLGLLPVLLLLGGLAARIGNRATLLRGLSFALAGHVSLLLSPTMQMLVVTRLLQGISIALSLAAATAQLVELGQAPARAARLSSMAVTWGLGGGGLLTSACLVFGARLAPLSYHAVAIATAACGVGVWRLRASRSESAAPLVRRPLITAQTAPFGVALFCAWSLTGIILATLPRELSRLGAGEWTGVLVFVAIVSGVAVQVSGNAAHPARAIRVGIAIVAAAWLTLIVGLHVRSLALVLFGAALSGLSSFGFAYIGAVTGTLLACPAESARALCGLYLFGYAGFGLPCIGVGYATDAFGPCRALLGYGACMAVGLALFAASRRLRAAPIHDWRHAPAAARWDRRGRGT